jgi:hypothetical protein
VIGNLRKKTKYESVFVTHEKDEVALTNIIILLQSAVVFTTNIAATDRGEIFICLARDRCYGVFKEQAEYQLFCLFADSFVCLQLYHYNTRPLCMAAQGGIVCLLLISGTTSDRTVRPSQNQTKPEKTNMTKHIFDIRLPIYNPKISNF